MAASVKTSLPAWLTGCTYDASGGNDLRNSTITPVWFNSGIMNGSSSSLLAGVAGGAGLHVAAGTGMTVTVGAGSFVVPVSGSPTSGGYASALASQATLTVLTADPSNPRIDLVVAYVSDVGTSSSYGAVQIYTGTAAASPSAPSAPANSVTLAQIRVPAGATSITSGDITDARTFTVAAGGVMPVATKASAPTAYRGALMFDQSTGSFYHQDGAASFQARMLPFAPSHNTLTGTWVYPGGHYANILSTTVVTDGNTDLKVTCHIGSISPSLVQDVDLTHTVTVDGDVIHAQTLLIPYAGNNQQGGFTMVAYTDGSLGNSPSGGTHTVAFAGQASFGQSNFPQIHQLSNSPISAYMRVEPVGL